MEKEMEDIMRLIFRKLIRMDKWGGAHTEITNLTKGLPEHYRRDSKGQRAIQKAVKELIKREFLLVKPSTGELHVSLNNKKIKDIGEFLK